MPKNATPARPMMNNRRESANSIFVSATRSLISVNLKEPRAGSCFDVDGILTAAATAWAPDQIEGAESLTSPLNGCNILACVTQGKRNPRAPWIVLHGVLRSQ